MIVEDHVDWIMPHAFVYIRSSIENAILEKNRTLFESGQLGWFRTGASMEQPQVFNQDWRYSRYRESCKTEKRKKASSRCPVIQQAPIIACCLKRPMSTW